MQKNLMNKLGYFIGIGFCIALGFIALIFVSYVLLYGAIIGLILFAGSYLYQTFFAKQQKRKSLGKTYDHNDLEDK